MFNCCLNDDILTHSMLVVAKQTEYAKQKVIEQRQGRLQGLITIRFKHK